MLSQTSQYALRAVLFLADRPSPALVRVGVLASGRGPAGGFRLAREPHGLPLGDVVAPFDPVAGPRRCLLGRPACGGRGVCAAHEAWSRASGQVEEFFRTTSVAELLSLAPAAPATSSPRRPR